MAVSWDNVVDVVRECRALSVIVLEGSLPREMSLLILAEIMSILEDVESFCISAAAPPQHQSVVDVLNTIKTNILQIKNMVAFATMLVALSQ